MIRLLACVLGLLLALTCAAAPTPLAIPDEPPGIPGAGLPVNLLLNFGATLQDAGAAYREPYRATRRYAGYFNAQLCYRYPLISRPGAVPVPDLDERTGHFAPSGAADARHECRSAFSGNFLNWASMSTLDMLRYALTGGDRVIDTAGETVLQRAWLPDGGVHADFYANPEHFPRKTIPLGGDASAPSAVTPFGADQLYIVSCRNRLLFSNTAQGKACDSPRLDAAGQRITSDKFYGEFNARVAVCSAEDALLRPELCARYRDGYKPQGVLHQTDARIGLMGYLTELQGGGTQEYGGALRAPLKMLGPLPATGSAKNGKPGGEWHPDTGVLVDSPDSKSAAVSGALNYINRLGRSNPRRLGAYSRGDPGAELYYEALRYLQGRPASIAAGLGSDDGLPIWRTAEDPVALACQRTIVATIGHAAFSQDRFVPGNTLSRDGDAARAADSFAPSAFNVMQATRRVGELEAASGVGHAGLLRSLDNHGAGPGGSGSYYLAGAAHWAHTSPIRADKPVRIDSHALQLGASTGPLESALYYAAKYGGFDDRNGDGDPNVTTAGARDPGEWTDGGTPRHFHRAPNPADIIPAVHALFSNPGGATIKGAMAIGGAGEAAYLIETAYDSGNWSGTLQRRKLRIGSDGAADLPAAPDWDAGALLTGTADRPPEPLPGARKIYTLLRTPGQPSRTVALRWADLPADVHAYFDSIHGAAPDGRGEARVDYLRGVRRFEAGQTGGQGVFRKRTGILGAIVRSVPLIVGPPSSAVQGEGYAAFLERGRGRRHAIYVGANDGMLHAFDAATGRELFAYAPHALLPALAQLTSPASRRRAWVDASAGQGEALVRGRWTSVLAAGMGMGARGLFALDVSNPAAFADGLGALWEFTEHDDPAIGHVSAPPRIVKLVAGAKDGAARHRYYVAATSGINPASGNGTGALFLLALDKPPEQKWQLGVNYFRFVTPAADGNATRAANALSPPALAIGGDGAARYAWAGDLQGRLWRFDLTGKPPWGGTLARPLFQSRDANGAAQAIAHAPAVVFAPGGGYLILLATGRLLEQADLEPGSFRPQSFYAVHDRLAPDAAVAARSALEPRTLSGSGPYLIKGKPVSYTGEDARPGWYLDFPNPAGDGERAAGSPIVRAGAVLFDTVLPGRDACAPPAQRSYLLDALSGAALGPDGSAQEGATTGELASADDTPASLAWVTPPLLLEIGTSGGPRTATGVALATRRYAVLRPGSTAKGVPVQQLKVTFAARRLSWRQVANWKDIHDKVQR